MNKFAFIGGFDKIDMLLFLAKIAALSNQRVLLIDATIVQRARYVVPVMSPTQKYITTFEDIDVAVGFRSLEELTEYIGEENLPYDTAIIDIDSPHIYRNFKLQPTDEHCFVTGFDLYSLKRGIEVLQSFANPIRVTKIYFTKDMLPEEDEYLSMLTQNLKVVWDEDIVFFPFERGDRTVLNTNQRFAKIKIRGLSKDFLEAVMFIAEKNLRISSGDIRKAIKVMEKA